MFLTGRLYLTFQPALVSGSSCPCFLAALKVHSNTAISINFLVYLEMNRTLFDCGFKKNVELKNGGLYDITETLQKPVKMSTSDFKCQKCSIWRCIRSINIPKLRLTHWINSLQLSTLSLWIYMCNMKPVNRKRIVCLVRKRNVLKTVVEETSAVLHKRVQETNT